MVITKRQYSNSRYRNSGKIIANSEKYSVSEVREANEILNDWRSLHRFPLKSMQNILYKHARKIQNVLISQRLKRIPSIRHKLKRYESMNLIKMQDIGGLRVVVSSIPDLKKLLKDLTKGGKYSHKIIKINDYVKDPKKDGYRSIHVVYRFRHAIQAYNNLYLEVQLRTKLQHIFATTVETIGTLKDVAFKFGETDSNNDWSDFLLLASAAFAELEKSPQIDRYKKHEKKDIYKKFIYQVNKLKVVDFLLGYTTAIKYIGEKSKLSDDYFLLILDIIKKKVSIKAYRSNNFKSALEKYLEKEEAALKNVNELVVLVSTGSIDKLKKTYPNYFMDSKDFLKKVELIRNKIPEKDKHKGKTFISRIMP